MIATICVVPEGSFIKKPYDLIRTSRLTSINGIISQSISKDSSSRKGQPFIMSA